MIQYKEMTELEFFNGTPGTVTQRNINILNGNVAWFTFRYDSLIGKEGSSIVYSRGEKTTFFQSGKDPVVTTLHNELTKVEYDSVNIYNPVPGNFPTDPHDPLLNYDMYDLGGYFLCDRYVKYSDPTYARAHRVFSNYTIFEYPFVGVPGLENYRINTMQGVGILHKTTNNCNFFKIPGGCEKGSRQRYLSTKQNWRNLEVVVYPNPATNIIYFNGISFNEILSVTLVNLSG
ncbi:MAG: hypothetical protein GC181_10865 [Bacteroidetes bacterium]|nr:hypothetical protein [Bacteroidota bacterium]